ncbi:hypothetical protein SUGI_0901630 [Cryptomeria japonica]|nr:hypothetical protein SUGI_0901630 [Cryptomeria japonica]
MWSRRRSWLSFPMVAAAVVIGVLSGKSIFGPPLEEYWSKKLQEEAAKESAASIHQSQNSEKVEKDS